MTIRDAAISILNSHNETTDQPEAMLSLTEYAVLGLLAERPQHGFAISRDLATTGSIGKILAVRRSLVYRALDRLVEEGLVEPKGTEPGDVGPQRVIHRITPRGRSYLRRWLSEPVEHIRDIRLGFQLKLAFLDRSGQSPLRLLDAQRAVLESTLAALDGRPEGSSNHLELWRQYNAQAAAAYLDHLQSLYA